MALAELTCNCICGTAAPCSSLALASPAGPGSPRAAAVDLNRLDTLLEGADLPSDDEEDEDYE